MLRMASPLKYPDKYLKDLIEQANHTRASHDIWACIAGPSLRSHYKSAMNKHFILIKNIEFAMRQAFIVTLCSLYDTDSKAISLHKFAAYIRETVGLEKQWEHDFRKARKVAERLYNLRNTHFARLSEKKYERNYFQDAGLVYEDLTKLMDRTWSLLCGLAYKHDSSEIVYGFNPAPDLKRIFPLMKIGNKRFITGFDGL